MRIHNTKIICSIIHCNFVYGHNKNFKKIISSYCIMFDKVFYRKINAAINLFYSFISTE